MYQSELIRHKQSHNPPTHRCDDFGQVFKYPHGLKRHQRIQNHGDSSIKQIQDQAESDGEAQELVDEMKRQMDAWKEEQATKDDEVQEMM